MLRVGVLFGGRSGEHDVSLCSAASVISALDPAKYDVIAIGIDRDGRWYVQDKATVIDHPDFGRVMAMEKKGEWLVKNYEDSGKLIIYNTEDNNSISVDLVIPVVHGTFCEDGTLQGLLELAMVPYVGADVIGSAVGMDKDISKRLLSHGGIPVVPWITIIQSQWAGKKKEFIERCAEEIGLPLFVKPANTGSSVGVKKVKTIKGIADAVDYALQYDDKVLVEKAVDAREIECAVLGNDDPVASVPGEIIPKHEFYSYEAKYIDPDGAALVIPAHIDGDTAAKIRECALRAFKILNCSSMARVDFFLEKNGTAFYLNEINTIPGFTSISMYPKLFAYSGISYGELIDSLIELALERHMKKLRIKREI